MNYNLKYPLYVSCPFCKEGAEVKLYRPYDGYQGESAVILMKCKKCGYELVTQNEYLIKWFNMK